MAVTSYIIESTGKAFKALSGKQGSQVIVPVMTNVGNIGTLGVPLDGTGSYHAVDTALGTEASPYSIVVDDANGVI